MSLLLRVPYPDGVSATSRLRQEAGDYVLTEGSDHVKLEVGDTFTIVFLPDTQFYSESFPATFTAQTQWIADNAGALNIQMVLHVGDVVDNENVAGEWANADAAIDILDTAGIPYLIGIGNHDYPNNASNRDSTTFNTYFGPSRYTTQAWWDGAFYEGSKSENSYLLRTIAGVDYIFLNLEFGPRDGVLTWANDILTSYAARTAIVITHAFLTRHGNRFATGSQFNPKIYTLDGDINDGEDIWTSLMKLHDNVDWIQSGHDYVDDQLVASRLVSLSDGGNQVKQIFANAQGFTDGGSGYLRICTFNTTYGLVGVRTYSPLLDEYAEDASNQFTV